MLISAILLANRKIIGWPIGIISSILYSTVFFDIRLYADFGLQFIFIAQSIYGWWNWKIHKEINDKKLKETKIDILSNKRRVIYGISSIIIWIGTYLLLSRYTDANMPLLDSLVATLSIFANWLLIIRKMDSWIVWIVADILFIILFLYTGLYITSILYFIFLINAIYGFITWKRKYYR